MSKEELVECSNHSKQYRWYINECYLTSKEIAEAKGITLLHNPLYNDSTIEEVGKFAMSLDHWIKKNRIGEEWRTLNKKREVGKRMNELFA